MTGSIYCHSVRKFLQNCRLNAVYDDTKLLFLLHVVILDISGFT